MPISNQAFIISVKSIHAWKSASNLSEYVYFQSYLFLFILQLANGVHIWHSALLLANRAGSFISPLSPPWFWQQPVGLSWHVCPCAPGHRYHCPQPLSVQIFQQGPGGREEKWRVGGREGFRWGYIQSSGSWNWMEVCMFSRSSLLTGASHWSHDLWPNLVN